MKKLIIAILVVIGIIYVYNHYLKKDVTTSIAKKTERKIEVNKEARIGSTIVCPMCDVEFKKEKLGQVFDCKECKDKYDKMIEYNEKLDETVDKASNVVSDLKTSVKKNFGKKP